MAWTFADVYEVIAEAIPDREALVHGEIRRSWAQYEQRAARLAAVMAAHGLGPDSKLAILAFNTPEYLEAQLAGFKLRGVPINVNYRYFENELLYLFDNSDSECIVFQARFAERLAALRDRLPKVRLYVEIDDGSGQHLEGALDYESAIESADPMPRIRRSEDDIYMFYTGGTTGMPKGVMYRQGDFAPGLFVGYELRGLARPANAAELAASVVSLQQNAAAPRCSPACPLMHGTGMWFGALSIHHLGGTVVTVDNTRFDADQVWQLVQRERLSDMVIVGDAFGKPMLQALDAAEQAGSPHDIGSLRLLVSSGVMFSAEVKRGLLRHGDFTIVDGIGSTEGSVGVSVMNRQLPESQTARFTMNETTRVFTEDGREVQPGSGEIGMVANGGLTPIGYFKDPQKSSATFRVVNGHRYSFPGDYATIAADGTLVLLGRGSVCINTGGEKVFPEEVEELIKSHPAVYDCLVAGVPDERFGERVTAVVSLRDGMQLEESAGIAWLHGKLAGYKLPKRIVLVDEVKRADNGKPDYRWAREVAIARSG